MSDSESWTIGRLITWTTKYLAERGSDSPRLDAELLLAHAVGCPRIGLYTTFDTAPADPVRTAFRELVRRRAEGTPVAYLLGRREFYSMEFEVTPDVLIPRPETEFLAIAVIDAIRRRPEAKRVADIGTGSGIIAVTVAKNAPQVRVTAVDTSPQALQVAQRNATRHQVADRVDFLESDLLAKVSSDVRYDVIASNPPYVSTAEMATLAADAARHEPRAALEAGPLGTEVIERIIPEAAERLAPGGELWLEMSPLRLADVQKLIASDDRFEALPTIKDLAGLARVVGCRRKA
jgi:release factor glutamine methyltransferase